MKLKTNREDTDDGDVKFQHVLDIQQKGLCSAQQVVRCQEVVKFLVHDRVRESCIREHLVEAGSWLVFQL